MDLDVTSVALFASKYEFSTRVPTVERQVQRRSARLFLVNMQLNTHDADRCDSVVELEDRDAHQAVPAAEEDVKQDTNGNRYGWRFWIIFTGLALSALLSGLEGSIMATALPTILADLGAGENYVWVMNIYFLTRHPLYGQLADLWGRRWLMISSVAIFTAAGAISGTAQTTSQLLAGRGLQGIGAGGINMLVDLIICDLVPLRDRGSKTALLFGLMTVASAVGPLVGGALASRPGMWRWIFYLNLPTGAAALLILFVFLRVRKPGDGGGDDATTTVPSARHQLLRRIDWVGNALLIASTTLVQYVLTYAGSRYAWGSAAVIGPLCGGLALLVVFALCEGSPRLCPHPVVPGRVAGNRTSAAALVVSFNHALLAVWVMYFLPVYLQAVRGSTPRRAGAQLLPVVFAFPAAAAGVGAVMARTGGWFRAAHFGGLLVLGVGVGCCSLLGPGGGDAPWVVLEVVVAAGLGAVMPALLPAVQAELREADAAASTAAWAFVRSVGTIWGVSVPAAVFNNRFAELVGRVGDAGAREALGEGGAYEHASKAFVESFASEETRRQIVRVYADSLKRMWQIGVVFAGVSFVAVFFERPVKLRKELETDFGLEKETKSADGGEAAEAKAAQVGAGKGPNGVVRE
ncbi:major facilitator superfamily protein [Diplodia corticola]|uniref:Major facilitator superfamily protein n=1 Tax=Diplodia corticola TaxID=236234 RepID=A0A1J9RCP6_9PEZI|nr:major facilitator superfamily protein [Diplodia corticola]OJD30267.1 major facilitator superfamily protein [Diplodia corticola]